jgi:hypothetical protein
LGLFVFSDTNNAAIMQILWSRAQARAACRCGSCLHAAIARRTTTAASRRRLKVSDIFTACYSTILATAAFADAKVKEDRRKEWDRVIAEAKAGIPANESEAVERTLSQPISDSLGPIITSGDKSQPQKYLFKPAWGGNGWTVSPRIQETSLESKLRILDSQLKGAPVSPQSFDEQEVVDLPSPDIDPAHEWVEETPDGQLPPREPKRELHLRKMEEMIAKLVDRLLLQTSIFSAESSGVCSAVLGSNNIRGQMNDIAERIETLRTGFTRLPAYSWIDVESMEEQRSALHRSLSALCHRATPSKSSIDLMLAKICYNLLISTAPPSIFTYNTLLREFNRLRQPHLTQIVVDSYFFESKLKLNKTTALLILNHYRIKEDPDGFNIMSKRMGGHDKSMRIKRRHTDDLWKESVKEWALTNKVIHREAFLYQKMPRGAAIFHSLICGSLEMKRIRCAIRYVRAALREGIEVTSEALCNIIKNCLAEVDRLAGISLLRAILWWTADFDVSTTFYSPAVRSQLYRLLSLCGIDPSLGSRQYLPLKLPGDLLEQMLCHMRIESITESVERFTERISSLENVFSASGAELSDLDRVMQAIELVERADGLSKRRVKNKRKSAAEGRWIRLRSLESMLGTHETRINARQVELLPLAFAKLSTEQKNRYLQTIRMLGQGGQAAGKSERLELLSRFIRMQSQGRTKRVEPPSDDLPARRTKKTLPTNDTIEPQQTSSLVTVFPISKPEIRAVTF